MPTLTFPGMPAATKAKTEPPTPTIHPGVDLAAWAETEWLAAQVAAGHVLECLDDTSDLNKRISKGYDYIAQHPEDKAAHLHLWRLEDRCSDAYARMRLWLVSAWRGCQSVYGLRTNGKLPSAAPEALWAELGLGGLMPPEIVCRNGGLVVDPPRTQVAGWEREAYAALLESRATSPTRSENAG